MMLIQSWPETDAECKGEIRFVFEGKSGEEKLAVKINGEVDSGMTLERIIGCYGKQITMAFLRDLYEKFSIKHSTNSGSDPTTSKDDDDD